MSETTPRGTPDQIDSAQIIAVLSMLHEPEHRPSSAQRRFRGQPVLAWTLRRLSRAKSVSNAAILCWEDQLPQVTQIAREYAVKCLSPSRRISLPMMDSISAARRWADGWRGGLMASCEFDRGFHATWAKQILEDASAESVFLVDPSAGLLDPEMIDRLIEHARANEEIDFFFSPAAPGLSGVLIRKSMLQQLAAINSHPGALLAYRPDSPQKDPLAMNSCAPIPSDLARTTHRFTLDSNRQIERISLATEHLNGELIGSAAEQLHRSLKTAPAFSMPREIILELTIRRNTSPIYWPGTHLAIQRPDMPMDIVRNILDELAGVDDMRLVLAGVGDPLLYPDIFDVISRAAAAGISIAIETDLVGIEPPVVDWLADSPLDIVSVFLPAASARTYQAVMGFDGMKIGLDNLRQLIERRQSRRSGTPLLVPTFVKTKINLAEMEPWYDHWLRVLGCAVITGPSDFSARIPDCSAARMEPPLRKPCARLASRATILSNGTIVSCDQDVLGQQPMGIIGKISIRDSWNKNFSPLRTDHDTNQLKNRPVCANCSEWHRP
jgi:hypothetical protein